MSELIHVGAAGCPPKTGRMVLPALVFLAAAGLPVRAHETDQYTVPLGREFADLRMYFARDVHDKLSDVVQRLNGRIAPTLVDGRPTAATDRFYSPDTIATMVLYEFPPVILFIETYDAWLRERSVQNQYPGLIVSYTPTFWIYHHWALLLNPTKITRQKRCSMVMVDGTYFGMDKYAHFVHMGYIYFSTYRGALTRGASEPEAVRRAVGTATGSNLFLSENALLGMFTTGVRSNGDLAANYSGFKFFRNLTEPVTLRGIVRPPMLVREGVYWRINDHVRPNSDFFAYFVSDHWNEALNPNTYEFGTGACIRSEIQDRCDQILEWYRDEQGRRRTQDDFRRIAAELSAYYGEDYGHGGGVENMVQIANTCFDERGNPEIRDLRRTTSDEVTATASASQDNSAGSAPPTSPKPLNTPAIFGVGATAQLVAAGPRKQEAPLRPIRRPLAWAACDGEAAEVLRLCQAGADVNAQDADGETALHCAARWGFVEVAKTLIEHGAAPSAPTRYGVTPLHLAVRELRPEVAALLLATGADSNAADAFGCTPLHDAASRGYTAIAGLLLAHKADPNVADAVGTTPLHRAARQGHPDTAELLVHAGAGLHAVNLLGKTPAEEAVVTNDAWLVGLLRPEGQRKADKTAARPQGDGAPTDNP